MPSTESDLLNAKKKHSVKNDRTVGWLQFMLAGYVHIKNKKILKRGIESICNRRKEK